MDHSPDQPPVEPRAFARRTAVAPGLFVSLGRDKAITADEPAVTSASMLAARQSIAFLNSAHTTEEINR